jgi:hypothetical protein
MGLLAVGIPALVDGLHWSLVLSSFGDALGIPGAVGCECTLDDIIDGRGKLTFAGPGCSNEMLF